ncbi:MAG: cytochrome c1 [Alphaproteobacteria bacterium]
MTSRILLTALALIIAAPSAFAAGDSVKPPKQDWSFNGPFGTYDKAALQRGYKVYKEVCAACHSMKRIYFRNLEALGYDEGQIKNIAAEYTVIDGPDAEGEMFERTARLSDPFPSPYPNKEAAKAANGSFPPDLSLITKARKDGSNYVYGILTGYDDPAKHGAELMEGQHWNKYMPGHVIAMAAPLSDGQIAFEDGSPETLDQYARDVAHFLTWAAEPEMEDRKRIGLQVILFLLVFTGIFYRVKKRIWKDVH